MFEIWLWSRILLEGILLSTVDALVQEFAQFTGFDGDRGNKVDGPVLTQRGFRWWSESMAASIDSSINLDALRMGWGRCTPFDQEGMWFQALECGDKDELNVSVVVQQKTGAVRPSRSKHPRPEVVVKKSPRSFVKEGHSDRPDASDSSEEEIVEPEPTQVTKDFEKIKAPTMTRMKTRPMSVAQSDVRTLATRRTTVAVQKPRKMYLAVDGYADRKDTIIAAVESMAAGIAADSSEATSRSRSPTENFGFLATPIHVHWWPWVYEVLIVQWLNLLEMFHAEDEGVSTPSPVLIPRSPTVHSRDSRNMSRDHGPSLLRMILKSMVMRITTEEKPGPVVLDIEVVAVLERLTAALTIEILKSNVTQARRLNSALAHFFRSLFGVCVPSQASRFICIYFATFRDRQKSEEIDHKLKMMEELSLFDHFVAINFPLPTDAHSVLRKSDLVFSTTPLDGMNSVPLATSSHMKPRSNSFSNRLSVGMTWRSRSSIRLSRKGFLVDPHPHWLAVLIVQECMDAYRRRLVTITVPALRVLRDLLVRRKLLKFDVRSPHFLVQVRHSYDARYQSIEARERVAVLYMPLLHDIIHEASALRMLPVMASERRELLIMFLHLLQDLPVQVLRDQLRKFCEHQVLGTDCQNGFERMSCSSLPFCTKQPLDTKWDDLTIIKVLVLLHLCFDTFEMGTFKHMSNPVESDTLCGNKSSRGVNTKGVAEKKMALEKLTRQRGRPLGGKKTRKSSPSPSTRSRAFSEGANVAASDTRVQAVGITRIDPETRKESEKALAAQAAHIVICTLLMVLEECPTNIFYRGKDRNFSTTLGTKKDGLCLTSAPMLRMMHMALSLILHGLSCYQVSQTVVDLFGVAMFVLQRFGAMVFLIAVGDSLQDWMRIALLMASSPSDESSIASSNFILHLLRGSYYYLGSIQPVADNLLAVFDDAIELILKSYTIQTLVDEDNALHPLHRALTRMLTNVRKKMESTGRKHAPMYTSILLLMESLCRLFEAYAMLRHHASHPVVGILRGYIYQIL